MSEAFNELAAHLGESDALEVCRRLGGAELYIPRPDSLSDDHLIVKRLGRPLALRLAEFVRGEKISLPRAQPQQWQRRNRAIRIAFDAGATHSELALQYGVTSRRIRQILEITPTDPPTAAKRGKP